MTQNKGRTFHFDERGQWSGGGSAFLNNARHAASRHSNLRPTANSIPIVPRNVPAGRWSINSEFVLAPQNAWPWNPVANGAGEASRVVLLRAATEVSARRAMAVLRISSAIPKFGQKTSPVFHNVLDTGFEEASKQVTDISIEPAAGRIVTIGDFYSYKNLPLLLKAYRRYREGGGHLGLLIIGKRINQKVSAKVDALLQGLDDVALVTNSLSRAQCLAAMRQAEVVVLPPIVEASPFSALEAVWANPNTILSSITGNREIFSFSSRSCVDSFFDPHNVGELTQRLWTSTNHPSEEWHVELQNGEFREQMRVQWGDDIAEWVESVG